MLGILSSRSVHIIELYVQHTITHSAHSLILDILSNRRMHAISLSISAHDTITHCARSLILDILSNRPMHIIRLSVQHTITHCARFFNTGHSVQQTFTYYWTLGPAYYHTLCTFLKLILGILSSRSVHIIELSVQHTITHSARSLILDILSNRPVHIIGLCPAYYHTLCTFFNTGHSVQQTFTYYWTESLAYYHTLHVS